MQAFAALILWYKPSLIDHTQRNGKKSYDDYIEHEPGALQALQEYLDASTTLPNTASEGCQSRTFPLIALSENVYNTSPSRGHTSGSSDLADQSLELPDNLRSSISPSDLEIGAQTSKALYLFSCTKRRRHPVKLHQEAIAHIMDDRQLFHLLRRVYWNQKKPFESYWSLRAIQNIHFMKVSRCFFNEIATYFHGALTTFRKIVHIRRGSLY